MKLDNELEYYINKHESYKPKDNIIELFSGDEYSNKKLIMKLKIDLENAEKYNKEKIDKLESDILSLKNKSELEEKKLLNCILDILDEFERLNSYVKETNNEKLKVTLQKNMRYINNKLSNNGIEKIDCIGKLFDETYHECVQVVKDNNVKNLTITEEIKPGYIYKGNVIRATEVKIIKN